VIIIQTLSVKYDKQLTEEHQELLIDIIKYYRLYDRIDYYNKIFIDNQNSVDHISI